VKVGTPAGEARMTVARSWAAACLLLLAPGLLPALPAATIVDCQIGLGGKYKLGLWTPAQVTVEDASGMTVEVVAPDGDGIPARYLAKVDATNGRQTLDLFVKVGRRDTPVEVRLANRNAASQALEVVARQTFSPGAEALASALPPTISLLAELDGSPSSLLRDTATARGARASTRVARLTRFDQLPSRWVGYEGVDCLLISLAQPLAENNGAQGSDAPTSSRVAALTQWVEMGGRLVIIGGAGAEASVGAGGLLADLLPGKFAGDAPFAEAAPLQRFAEDASQVNDGEPLELRATRLTDIKGEVLVKVRGGTADDALIVRAPRGLGEVTFVAVDLHAAALANWPGLPELVSRLCRLPDARSTLREGSASAPLVSAGYSDLSGALQQRLGASFTGVTSTPLLAIVAAAMVYLALIGPVDYFFLKKVTGRMEGTWITFPLIAILFGGGAYWLGERAMVRTPQLNQLELVDIDVASGHARSAVWAQALSPTANRYDVSLAPRWADGSPRAMDATNHYVSWLGMPGKGLGGLAAPAGAYTPEGVEYAQPAALDRCLGVPINRGSTKALAARWRGKAPRLIQAELTSLQTGTIDGTLSNMIDKPWRDAVLLFDGWAWRLGDIAPGGVIDIAQQRAPVKISTFVRNDHLRDGTSVQTLRLKELSDLSVDGLLYLMMLTDALGDSQYTRLGNRFQAFTDLSRALDSGAAVLVARAAAPGSQLLRNNQPWTEATDQDRVYYRFLLPVAKGRR